MLQVGGATLGDSEDGFFSTIFPDFGAKGILRPVETAPERAERSLLAAEAASCSPLARRAQT